MKKYLFIIILSGIYVESVAQTAKDLYFVKHATEALLKVPKDSAIIAKTLMVEMLKMRAMSRVPVESDSDGEDSIYTNSAIFLIDSLAEVEQSRKMAVEEAQKLAESDYSSSEDVQIITELAATRVEWSDTTFDFGAIKEGKVVKHRFTFTNKGQHDFLIGRVKPSCGCTTTSYTRVSVAPDESGFVEIEFNSSGKSGKQEKHVTVIGNFEGDGQQILSFEGEVVGKK